MLLSNQQFVFGF